MTGGVRDRLRGSLQTRVYLLVMWSALAPVALLSWGFASRVHRLDDQLVAARAAAAEAAARQEDEELLQGFENLQRAATAGRVALTDQDPAPERAALADPRLHVQFPQSAFFLDAQGRLVVEVPDRGARSLAPPPGLPAVEETVRTGRPVVSPVTVVGGERHVYQLVPVRDWQGRVTGLAGGVVDAGHHHVAAPLRSLAHAPGGAAVLADGARQVVASAGDAGGLLDCPEARALVEGRKAGVVACRAPAGRRDGEGGGRSVVAVYPLASAPWSVVARFPEAEVLAGEGFVPGWLGFLTALSLALGALLAWGVSRSIAQPVSSLTAAAERIAGGDLGDAIESQGPDEVGRLAKALELMRESLRSLLQEVEAANHELEGRVALRTAELARANEQLRQREEALAHLYEKVVAAQEDERKRIARELHDDTSQSLAALVMAIDTALAALRAGKDPRLEEARALAKRTIEDVHRMILDLRPSVLDDLGLQSAIRWYAERHLAPRGISVRCEFDVRDRRWPAAFETAVFRICQEAMSNVAHHSEAESVLIQASEPDGRLHIEIEDDGKGFDPGSAGSPDRRHFGLMGIRERVEILGGKVRFDTAPGQGTRIAFDVPFPPES